MLPTLFTDRILRIPTGAILVTVGAGGSGKSRWAERNFDSEQILALDDFRRLIAGSETASDHSLRADAFELLMMALEQRARRRITTLVDGAFVDRDRRRKLVAIARRFGRPAIAICFRVPAELAQYRNKQGGRVLPSSVLRKQVAAVEEFAEKHGEEGWDRVVFFGDSDTDLLPVVRYDLPEALPREGPFDVIGDVHGCAGELDRLLDQLGWHPAGPDGVRRHPAGRTAVFVGDFADRGPDSAAVFRRVIAMHRAGTALAVPGNHCVKLLRYLQRRPVEVSHGLGSTVEQLDQAGEAFQHEVRDFLQSLPRVLALAGGRLVVFHAALPRESVGRQDEATAAQTIFGVVRGTDEHGFPIRDAYWTEGWRTGEGEPLAIYGHTPVPEPVRQSNTIDIDGGCVFGGYLCAFRFPEHELVYEPAQQVWYTSPKVHWRGAPPR